MCLKIFANVEYAISFTAHGDVGWEYITFNIEQTNNQGRRRQYRLVVGRRRQYRLVVGLTFTVLDNRYASSAYHN